jgi:D-alanine-D-alanine ligase
LIIPAPLSQKVIAEIQDMALRTYKAIDCAGMARVDFLLNGETNQIYVNEVNTIPGFTKISMYPKLWEASGLTYSELIDELIDLAFERKAERNRSERKYSA